MSATYSLPALDGIRALAVLGIVLGHYVQRASSGMTAGIAGHVVGFAMVVLFTLAGYLVTRGFAASVDDGEAPQPGRYIARRIARAAPVALAFLAAALAFQLYSGLQVPAWRTLSYLLLLGNYYNGIAVWDESRHLVGHLWSLMVGAQYLILWVPLLAWILRRGLERQASLLLLVVAVVVGGARVLLLATAAATEVYVYNATELRVDALALGSAAALGQRAGWRWPLAARAPAWPLAAALLLASYLAFVTRLPGERLAAGITIEAALVALALTGPFHRTPAGDRIARRARLIRELCYSLFVWHVFGLAFDDTLSALSAPVRVCAVLVITASIAAISWWLLDRPARTRWPSREGSVSDRLGRPHASA